MTVPGHFQRGGTRTAFDHVLATRFGIAAEEQIVADNFNGMAALQGTRIETVRLKMASMRNPVDPDFYYHLTKLKSREQ